MWESSASCFAKVDTNDFLTTALASQFYMRGFERGPFRTPCPQPSLGISKAFSLSEEAENPIHQITILPKILVSVYLASLAIALSILSNSSHGQQLPPLLVFKPGSCVSNLKSLRIDCAPLALRWFGTKCSCEPLDAQNAIAYL